MLLTPGDRMKKDAPINGSIPLTSPGVSDAILYAIHTIATTDTTYIAQNKSEFILLFLSSSYRGASFYYTYTKLKG